MTAPALPSIASTTRSGVIVMFAGILMFSLNDVMGKWLVSTYSVGQLVFIRSFAALIFLTPFLLKGGLGRLVAVERPTIQILRVVLSTFEVIAFYYALAYLPLADAMTYALAAPIYVAAAAPLFLREKVGWRRWTAIVIGFVGVVVALQPSAQSLTLPALVAILGSMAFAFMIVSGRMLRQTPDTTLVFWQILGAAVAGFVTLPFSWVPVSAPDFGLLCLLGIVAMLAHVLVNRALKLADAATVAPLNYMLLVWAILFGWLVFGEVPRTATWIGAGLIVGSGLFIYFRERQLKEKGSGQ